MLWNYNFKTWGKVLVPCFLLFFVTVGCGKMDTEDLATFKFELPKHFPEPTYDFDANPISKGGVELGKKLFMDGQLSSDGTISCSHCHMSTFAFTQHGHALSHGINNLSTKRNSQPIQNLAWKPAFGWDGGVFDLDLFAINPITNPVEMHEELGDVLEKLRASEEYPELFLEVFGSPEITTDHFLKALAQFQLFCISANSPYDKYVLGEGQLSAEELEGMELFESKCASCHEGVLQSDFSFRNNGLSVGNPNDLGREEITGEANDRRKFNVPSLRNLKYTFPYMHDGRFFKLAQVLEHYANGVEYSATLDPILGDEERTGIPMTNEEQAKIISFLNTLNDESFVNNELLEVF